MFSSSTQLKFWTFSGTTEINKLRAESNLKYITECNDDQEEEAPQLEFLSVDEESKIRRHYEYVLKDFCTRFQPPMPKYTLGTSMIFLKRFYLHNSVMDYHPKDVLHTCVYLACKVEEFNVSLQQFVANLPSSCDRERAADVILAQELLFMQQLHYHLTVHNPFRPLEGLVIDIKTRCPELPDVEKLRRGCDDFLDRALHTDVLLIFSPSQIALAAILHSASKQGCSLDSYVANKLLTSGGRENLMKTVEHIKRIRYTVKNMEQLDREQVRVIEAKLELCRNQENNPESDEYRQCMDELWEEEEERQTKKRTKQKRKLHEEAKADKELLGF